MAEAPRRRTALSRVRGAGAVLAVAALGSALAVAALGDTTRPVGPFEARLGLRPASAGVSVLGVPPLGEVRFRTHSGPVALAVRLQSVHPDAVTELAAGRADLRRLGEQVRTDLRRAVLVLVLRDGALALAGAGLAGLLVLRRPRAALAATGCTAVLLLGTGAVVATTFAPTSLTEPEFTGALAYAPAVIGDARDVVDRLDSYSQQLGALVTNVVTLYDAASTLPSYTAAPGTIRVLHVSDLHLSPSAYPLIGAVAAQFDVDLVLDTGDVVDHGSALEDAYVDGIASLDVPYVYVRGNHDSAGTESAVRRQRNAVVLTEGSPVTVAGLTIIGEGDPRFTPDKRTDDDTVPDEELREVGRHLLAVVQAQVDPPDLMAVHDPVSAQPLLGQVPLVLAGHAHRRAVSTQDGTRLMVQGSTGGAGLRALEGDAPTPVELTVLYFDGVDHTLQAYDEITLGGLGLADARISRQVVPPPVPARVPEAG